MSTERVTISLSSALLAAIDAQAERDAPGSPNRSATIVRLLALAMGRPAERVWHRVEVPPGWRERRAALLRGSEWCRPMADVLEGREGSTITVPELVADAGQAGDERGRARACYVLRRMGWERA